MIQDPGMNEKDINDDSGHAEVGLPDFLYPQIFGWAYRHL